MIGEFAAHAAVAGIFLHQLQTVEDDQVRPAVAQPAFEAFEATAGWRVLLFVEKELIAFAQEGVGIGPLVERPDQHVGFAGLHGGDDPLGDRRLTGASRGDQRPDTVRRRQVGDPCAKFFEQSLTAADMGRRLKSVDDT
ncbi:MAG TPA: hypothetical protein VFE62_22015, partial [Gemmataceae bacterium]|nr:hypothetical protein [Gemmataceae bacterium]